jgi:hypothetical protein
MRRGSREGTKGAGGREGRLCRRRWEMGDGGELLANAGTGGVTRSGDGYLLGLDLVCGRWGFGGQGCFDWEGVVV